MIVLSLYSASKSAASVSGFLSGEGLACLKACLLFLAVVAGQVRHYIKPQGLSFPCLPATVATTVLSLELRSITQTNLKLSVPWEIIKRSLSLPCQAFCPVHFTKSAYVLGRYFSGFQIILSCMLFCFSNNVAFKGSRTLSHQ